VTAPAKDDPRAPEAQSFIGRVISGRYKVLEQLGEGGMGTVYLAEHVHMRKRVAIKVLNPDMVEHAEVVARFEREAVAAAHIDHPNVAAATDFGRTDDGAFFLVLEYIEGTDLRSVLRQGPVSIARSMRIARQIASALTRAHELGIVHRDLKPENVMLVDRGDEGEIVKVLDFGIAKVHMESLAAHPGAHAGGTGGAPGPILTRAGAVFGTPEYMAPEQALGETVDARADLYALGVMMFEMLSGKLPFEASDTLSLLARQIAENAPMLRATATDRDISPELEALVMRLLAKQPRERFEDAEALLTAMESLPTAAPSQPQPVPSQPQGRGSTRVAGASSPHLFTPADAMARTMTPEKAGLGEKTGLGERRGAGDNIQRRHLLVAIVVAFCGGALFVGALLLLSLFREVKTAVLSAEGGAGASAAGSAPEKKALTDAQIDAATAEGPDALDKLAGEYPSDARIFRALYRAYLTRGDTPEAMRTIGRLVGADPNAANDAEIGTMVTAAATDSSPETRETAIDVLEGPLGAKGADLLYDLTTRTPAPAGKARLVASLNKPEVLGHASPSLLILLDFRSAKRCEDRRDLLPRIRELGDARILPQLKNLERSRGCGFLGTRDCWPCLHRDGELGETISAVQARL